MSQTRPDSGLTNSMPRWVKVSGIIVIVLVLVFVILHLTGNSFGPAMHTMPAQPAGQQP